MFAMFLLLATSGLPAWSVVCFIVGVAIWLFGLFFGWRYPASPNVAWAGRGVDLGTMLVILSIALHDIFGV